MSQLKLTDNNYQYTHIVNFKDLYNVKRDSTRCLTSAGLDIRWYQTLESVTRPGQQFFLVVRLGFYAGHIVHDPLGHGRRRHVAAGRVHLVRQYSVAVLLLLCWSSCGGRVGLE